MKAVGPDIKHFFRNNAQVVYSVILLILIPSALLINAILFINDSEKALELELRRKAALVNGVFGVNVSEIIDNPEALQELVNNTVEQNPEIKNLDVLVPFQDDYLIIASLDPSKINEVSKLYYHDFAWRGDDPVAFKSDSDTLSVDDQIQLGGSESFWIVVDSVKDEYGAKVALVALKLSSALVEESLSGIQKNTIVLLLVTLVVVILLLLSNMRMFRYTIRFHKLKEVDQMKDEFISMASHELRAPITGIRGYLSMILDDNFGELPKEAKEKLTMVSDESDRLHDLVEDLLEVSRIQQGRIKLDIISVNSALIIKKILNTFEHQAKEKKLDLRMNIAKDLPNVSADAGRLTQIIVNLTSNSVKYTFEGSITVSVTLETGKEDKIKIKVSDTGIGMSSKDREKLFEKFYRVQSEKTDKITGTGLGLWITRELVNLMGGEIYVDSIENKGTEVTILLPVYKSKQKDG